MHSVPNTTVYENIISQKDHKFRTRVDIDGRSFYDDSLISVVTRMHAFGTNTLEFGQAYSREIEISFFGSTANIGRNAEINVWVLPVSGDGMLSGSWIHKGQFYIDTRSKDGQTVRNTDGSGYNYDEEIISIVGFDAMMRGEAVFRTFPDSWINDGKTNARSLILFAADTIGVNVDPRTWWVMNMRETEAEKNFTVLLPTQYTIRESLGYVAALYGGSFIINDEGMLQLIAPWYTEWNANRYGDNICTVKDSPQGLTVIPPHAECTGVRMLVKTEGYKQRIEKDEGEEDDGRYEYEEVPEGYQAGSDSGYMFEIESPWGTQDQVEWLYGKLDGYQYKPYQAEAVELDPRAEIGDKIKIKNAENVETEYVLFSQEITFGPYLTSDIGAPGEEAIDHEYTYETSTERKFARRLEKTEGTLSVYGDEIDAKVYKVDTGDGFGWSLQLDKWIVYSGDKDNVVLQVDKDGLKVSGSGEFSGYISSSEIYIPDSEDPQFSVDRDGRMVAKGANIYGSVYVDGSLYVYDWSTESYQPVADQNDLNSIRSLNAGSYGGNGSGMYAVMSLASKLGLSTNGEDADEYPPNFKVGTLWSEYVHASDTVYSNTFSGNSHKFQRQIPGSAGYETIDLVNHGHTLLASETDGVITISMGAPTESASSASFNVADTKKYKDMVKALTITSDNISYSESGRDRYEITVTQNGEEFTKITTSTVYYNGWDDCYDHYDVGSLRSYKDLYEDEVDNRPKYAQITYYGNYRVVELYNKYNELVFWDYV